MGYIGSNPRNKDSVTTSQLVDDAVTNAKLVDDVLFSSVTSSIVSASGNITADTFTGTFNGALSSSAQIATSISGSSTSLSSSLSTRATTLESASGSFASDLVTLKGSGTTQGVGQSNSPTFTAITVNTATVTGTLTAQEVHTEFESASILFTSGSTIFGNSSDDVHNMTGSLNISGSLSVKDGALTVTDNVDFNGNLDVDGTANLDVVDIDGAVTQDGGDFVINEAGANYDFRVESDGNTHALVMDGAQGFIGMGASAPGYVNGNDHRGGNTQTTSGAGGLLHLEGLVPRIILDDTGDTPQFAIEAQDYFSILELADDSTSETTRFRIAKDTGNVGIGVSSPGGNLVVSSSTKTDVLIGDNTSVFSDTGRGNVEINGHGSAVVGLTVDGAAKGLLLHDGTDSYFRNYANGYFAIYTNNTEKVRIDSSGKVGIDTTSPQRDFVVSNGGAGGMEFGASDSTNIISSFNRSNSSYVAMQFETNNITFLTGTASDRSFEISSTGAITSDSKTSDPAPHFALRSTGDIAHGMTDYENTATYYRIGKNSNTDGGAQIAGYSENTLAMETVCRVTNEISAASPATSDQAPFQVIVSKKSGTSLQALDASKMLVAFRNHTTTRFIFDSDGRGYANNTFTTFSDSRLKKDVVEIPYGLDTINKLKPKKYVRHSGDIKDGKVILEDDGWDEIGFIAQDIKEIIPELISNPDNDETKGFYAMDDGKMTSVLVKAVQELSQKNEALEKRIEELEK